MHGRQQPKKTDGTRHLHGVHASNLATTSAVLFQYLAESEAGAVPRFPGVIEQGVHELVAEPIERPIGPLRTETKKTTTMCDSIKKKRLFFKMNSKDIY